MTRIDGLRVGDVLTPSRCIGHGQSLLMKVPAHRQLQFTQPAMWIILVSTPDTRYMIENSLSFDF